MQMHQTYFRSVVHLGGQEDLIRWLVLAIIHEKLQFLQSLFFTRSREAPRRVIVIPIHSIAVYQELDRKIYQCVVANARRY
jgi:hypothetical protein